MMLANYFKSALKHLSSNRFYALINVIGLSVGLACFILIALFVRYEFSYEKEFAQSERIYRVSRDYFASGESTAAKLPGMAAPAAALLKQDFPQIEQVARIFCCGAVVKTETGEAVLEGGYAMADSALFEIFDFEWLSGDPATALLEPYTMVLTRSAAQRHFGEADPMGQIIQYGGGQNWQTARVTGVIEDLPDNTHLRFDFLESNAAWTDCRCDEQEQTSAYYGNWDNNVFYTYVKLAPGADIAGLQSQAGAFFERHVAEGASRETGFTATPIRDIHLRSDRDSELWLDGDPAPAVGMSTLYTFSAIAVFILLLACINFMNLATALSARRAKEVGVRKVAGAVRGQLFMQFMLESGMLVVVAALAALAAVEFLLPAFGRFLVRELVIDYAYDLDLLLFLAVLVALTSVIAGSYPALYLSALKPEAVLRAHASRGGRAALLRKLLVVFQFAISIGLLVCTLVVHGQMEHVRALDPGFDREGLLVLTPNNVRGEEWQTLKQQWLARPDVVSVTSSSLTPFQDNPNTAAIRALGSAGPAGRMQFVQVDYGFFETYGIDILAGRAFAENFGTDRLVPGEEGETGTQPFVISASAAKLLGWTPEEALGQELELGEVQGARFQVDNVKGPVVGVVPDLHFESLHSAIEPLVYTLNGNSQNSVSLRLRSDAPTATIAAIREVWSSFRPDLPTNIVFLDERFDAAYLREERQGQVLTIFTGLALLIASLGLLGLAAHAAETRTKEIGVRKVLGSTVWSVVWLLTADFSKLVLLANLVAWPVAYAAMNRWLENFAYRIDLTPVIFIGGGLIALCIAWVTVGGTAAKAANAKPVLALRYE